MTKFGERLGILPHETGVYKFINGEGKLIYVGKARDLKKRVSSYFIQQKNHSKKTKKLVSEVTHIEYIVTPSEYDALLLENNLIKKNQPRYNILLKDDKTYPFICITKERFPQVYTSRNPDEKKGEYFGPFTSTMAMKGVLELIKKLYTIRTCKYVLSEENISKKKYKICLEYHINNCKGPCAGLQEESDYMKDIALVKLILKGHLMVVKEAFKTYMHEASERLDYENAQKYKDKLALVENFHVKSTIVNPKYSNIDVITIISSSDEAYINYCQVNNGAVILSQSKKIKKKLDETDDAILQIMLVHLRNKFKSNNNLILSNIPISILPENIECVVPLIGDKKNLLNFSLRNALQHKKDTLLKAEPRKNNILLQLQTDLHLKEYPDHIECFDNSNLQGTTPVASMVCFIDGKAAKSKYRHFNIKTVEGPDDFASMKEIVYRRYKRVLAEKSSLPKLIVIDGGKGQLSSASEALKALEIYGRVPIIGIAKRLEEVYYPQDSIPIHINKKSPSLRLLQNIRDEAHRFAITFHRDKRSKKAITTELDQIEGIGTKLADKLLGHFKSVKKISEAQEEELARLVGQKKAINIRKYFKNNMI